MALSARSSSTFPRLGGLLLACLVFGCHGAPPSPPEEESPQAPVKAEAAKKVLLGEWTELLGTTQPLPNHSARLSAAVEGRVLSVLGDGQGSPVAEGEQVKAGQVIVQLDDRVVRANREKLQATLDDLEEQKKQAGYALELARIEVNRLVELSRNTSTSGSLPLVSRVELNKARVAQKDAESKQLSVAAKQAATRAELKGLDGQLDFYTLRAPIAGRLGIVQVVRGQTLSAGTVVAEVVDLGQIDVLSYAPPDAAARIVLDQPAKLILEEAAGHDSQQSLAGKVAFVGVQASAETGNLLVKVRFPNPNLRLRTNAVVRVSILTKPEQERLTIPEAALLQDQDPPAVMVVGEVKAEKSKEGQEVKLGKAKKLQARIGIRDRERQLVEVLGLEDPEKKQKVPVAELMFITEGGHGLRDDDVVKLDEEKTTEPALLHLAQTITLPQVKGGFDLMAADVSGQRLFVAAQDNNTLEVLSIQTGKLLRSIAGLNQPKGVLYVPEANRLYISNGGDGTVRVFNAQSFEVVATVDFKEKANNLRYDSATKLLYVGYGKTFGAIGIVDTATHAIVGNIMLADFPKQFALEKNGSRMFVNVPTANHVAVLDRAKRAVLETWPIREAKENVPMAFDEGHHRLFIGCDPGRLVVLDAHGGKAVASLAIAAESDGISYDPERHRVYVSCGEGLIEVIEQADEDHYKLVEHIPTAAGAGTSLLVPQWGRLCLAVPQRHKQQAEVRFYQARP